MMRVSNTAVVRLRAGSWTAWLNVLQSSHIGDHRDDQLSPSSSSAHGPSCSDRPITFPHHRAGTGYDISAVKDFQSISRGLQDVSRFLTRDGGISECFGIGGRRDQWFWTASFKDSALLGHDEPSDCSRWGSLNLKKNSDRSILLQSWKSPILRLHSSNAMVDESTTGQNMSSEEKQTGTAEEAVPSRPKSIEDFKHEEIVGPTVERDLSETANQLRDSLGELTTFMGRLSKGIFALSCVQLLATVWISYFHNVGAIFGIYQGLAVLLSFILAYLLRHFRSAIEFFSMMEGRSRLRVLTLSLQTIKAIALMFFRADFVVKAVACGSLLALLGDVWKFQSSVS